jgi:putative Holliday junction resolvase
MGRIIAIDYGRKRTGLAVTDPLQLIAGGLITLPGGEVVRFLKEYVSKETVDLFLLGEPKQMNNQPSENMQWVVQFKKHLQREIPQIPLLMVDERFTSVLAHQTVIAAGIKKQQRRNNKELIDELSATILLQSYLDSKKQ